MSVQGRGRVRLPEFLTEVFAEPRARAALLGGSAALFAAGLDPRVWSAALRSVQSAVRLEPQIEAIILIAAVAEAGLLLAGGAAGDSARIRPIILGGLVAELLTALAGLVVPDGPFFVACRLVGLGASAFVIPAALASIATSYTGTARATAIGMAYGAYGAALAAGPFLLEVLPGQQWPAFVATVAACALAIAVARPSIPELERPTAVERPYVVATAWSGLAIVLVTTGVVWLGGGWDDPLRWALIVGGSLTFLGVVAYERRRRRSEPGRIRVDVRPVAVAVFVGLVLALAQTVPMAQLPLFFELVLRFGPFASIVALAPLFASLVAAGPVAGYLLERLSPRTLVGGGVVAVGLGDLALALLIDPRASYTGFIVPCLLVGAGFVIATTVRTAIIFAGVPRGLPATAAALNEASLAVGARIGIVLTATLVARTALSDYAATLAGGPAHLVDQALSQFRDLISAAETIPFDEIASALHPGDIAPYLDAYDAGVRLALVFAAIVAIGAGVVAWLLLGRDDPLKTVWDLQEERDRGTGVRSAP